MQDSERCQVQKHSPGAFNKFTPSFPFLDIALLFPGGPDLLFVFFSPRYIPLIKKTGVKGQGSWRRWGSWSLQTLVVWQFWALYSWLIWYCRILQSFYSWPIWQQYCYILTSGRWSWGISAFINITITHKNLQTTSHQFQEDIFGSVEPKLSLLLLI